MPMNVLDIDESPIVRTRAMLTVAAGVENPDFAADSGAAGR